MRQRPTGFEIAELYHFFSPISDVFHEFEHSSHIHFVPSVKSQISKVFKLGGYAISHPIRYIIQLRYTNSNPFVSHVIHDLEEIFSQDVHGKNIGEMIFSFIV